MGFNKLTIEDIRLAILDRSAQDNDYYGDLAFSDDEIEQAMIRAARAYNGIAPYSETVKPSNLPGNTSLFEDAVVAHLILSKMNQLGRNDIDFSAGDVQGSASKAQLQNLSSLYQEHTNRWKTAALARKRTKNLENVYFSL